MTSTVIDRHTLFGPTSQLARVPRRIARILNARVARRERSVDRRHAPRILAAIAAVRSDATTWVVQDSRAGEPTILIVGPSGGKPAAIVRVARSRSGQAGLDRAAAALDQLHVRLAALEVDRLLPVPIARGDLSGRIWLAESALAGTPAAILLADPGQRRRMLVATAEAIAGVHAATARPVVVDDAILGRWVTARVAGIAAVLNDEPRASAHATLLASVASRVATELRGRTLEAGWIHGDLWPANVLVTGDGEVRGIVDWDSAEDDELALHDRLHLALTTRRLVERTELGPVVATLLTGGGWTTDDRAVLDLPAGDGRSGLPDETALWLYWLRFVVSNLARRPELARDPTWIAANVEQVLACA